MVTNSVQRCHCGVIILINHREMATEEEKRSNALEVYRKRLLEHRESEAKVKNCM